MYTTHTKIKFYIFYIEYIFCEMKGKKVIHWGMGGAGENDGPVLILPWRCNFSIYLDIQVYYLDIKAITTFLWLILVLMCFFLLFIQFSVTTALLKRDMFEL